MTGDGRLRAVALAITAALVTTGCGEDPDRPRGPAPEVLPAVTVDEDLAARMPRAIAEDGVITVGTDIGRRPNAFLDVDRQRRIRGFDIDLFSLIARKIGFDARYVPADFEEVLAGFGSGRLEAGIAPYALDAERLGQATMISYLSSGTRWAVRSGNPLDVDPDDACGRRIAVRADTAQDADVTARSGVCEQSGEQPVVIDRYGTPEEVTAAVVEGRADAAVAEYPIVAHTEQQAEGALDLLGETYDPTLYAYAVPTDQEEFADLLADGLTSLIEEGTYEVLLRKWGLEDGALEAPEVDPRLD